MEEVKSIRINNNGHDMIRVEVTWPGGNSSVPLMRMSTFTPNLEKIKDGDEIVIKVGREEKKVNYKSTGHNLYGEMTPNDMMMWQWRD